jgi:DNA replication and repair protein RecF
VFINTLKIHNFRNIKYSDFTFTKKVNVFYGNNGVGKTSILESIYFLSTSKSFRKSTSKSIINFEEKSVTVFSSIKSQKIQTLSLSKNKSGKWSGKVNNTNINKQTQLSPYIKVVAIDPEVYSLIDAGPQFRRSFLDWFVFHVEHSYLSTWKKCYKCIKHLNSLYKLNSSLKEIHVWENAFIEFSNMVDIKRQKYFNLLKPRVIELLHAIQPDLYHIDIIYDKGWQNNITLSDLLDIDREKNIKYGVLQNGPHKMDIKIFINKFPASQTLSRGQKKIISILFYLAYVETLLKDCDIKSIVCLDDLDAELDELKFKYICKKFDELDLQLFITTVQESKLINVFSDVEMFHVKQ